MPAVAGPARRKGRDRILPLARSVLRRGPNARLTATPSPTSGNRYRRDGLGLDPATAVVHGTPHEGVRDYVTEHDVDLVAMGTRGRSDIEPRLFGSVTKRVLSVVDVPVPVVRGE